MYGEGGSTEATTQIAKRKYFLYISWTTKGNSAIVRARLIARASLRWCFAQVPVLRPGRILPRLEIKRESVCVCSHWIPCWTWVQK